MHITERDMEVVNSWVPMQPVTVSDGELRRRWAAVRKAMEDRGIDALVVHGPGYQRWFSDSPPRHATVFPRDEDMTVIVQAHWNTDQADPPAYRGAKRLLGYPNSSEAPFTRVYSGQLIEKALDRYQAARIGLVGGAPYETINYLKTHMTRASFVDADEFVDEIKVQKSAEEWELIRKSAEMHDDAMRTVIAAIRPGLRTGVLTALADFVVKSYGSMAVAVQSGSARPGTPARFGPASRQRVLEEGDVLSFLIECPGPGGYFTECGRTAVIGKASDTILEEIDFAVRAQKFALDLIKPGSVSSEIHKAYNQFVMDNGRPEEDRIFAHGQGYDLLERPLIRRDDSMRIMSSMNLAVHPEYDYNGFFAWMCDNFEVGPDGIVGRVNSIEQKIFEVY